MSYSTHIYLYKWLTNNNNEHFDVSDEQFYYSYGEKLIWWNRFIVIWWHRRRSNQNVRKKKKKIPSDDLLFVLPELIWHDAPTDHTSSESFYSCRSTLGMGFSFLSLTAIKSLDFLQEALIMADNTHWKLIHDWTICEMKQVSSDL